MDTSSDVRQAMAAVAMNYFGDIQGTVTAAAPGAGSSMGLTPSEWGSFVQNAMQDKTAAAFLMTSYASWRGQQTDDSLASNGQGDGPSAAQHAGYWNDQSIGMLDYFFASNYQAAGHQAGEGSNAVLETLTEAFNAGAATLLTSVAFGPEAGAAVITRTARRRGQGRVLQRGGEHARQDHRAAHRRRRRRRRERQRRRGQGLQQPDHDPGPLVERRHHRLEPVRAEPSTATGLPAGLLQRRASTPPTRSQYEQQYGGNFLNSDGTVMDASQMSAKQLAAYNAWLQDPAISNVVASELRGAVPGVVRTATTARSWAVAADVPAKHGPAKRGVTLLACAVTGAAACAVLAGCSSGPGRAGTGAGTALGGAARRQEAVQPGHRRRRGLDRYHLGGYETCGTDDPLATPSNDNSLQYTAQELMTPFSRTAAYPVFRRQVVEALDGIGWALRQTASGSSPATYYTGHRDGTDLRLVELDNQPGLGPTATIFLSGGCFDAGSSAQQLRGKGSVDNVTEPRPAATPTPKYS